MLCKKNHPVVGLTTFNTELLQISIPALGKIKQKFTLIIHNNNPNAIVTRNQIRRLGYRGALHIINADANVGLWRARRAIINAAHKVAIGAEWVMFLNDDDILLNMDVPAVAPNNFAIIQNMLVLQTRVADLMRAIDNPESITADGKDIIIRRPHVGFAGTLMRMNIVGGVMDVLAAYDDQIAEIDDSLEYYAPWDAIMWSWVNMYARHARPDAAPIFMDTTNYIKTAINTADSKYGRPAMPMRHPADQYAHAVARFDAVLARAMGEK